MLNVIIKNIIVESLSIQIASEDEVCVCVVIWYPL